MMPAPPGPIHAVEEWVAKMVALSVRGPAETGMGLRGVDEGQVGAKSPESTQWLIKDQQAQLVRMQRQVEKSENDAKQCQMELLHHQMKEQ